jgi:hypothetical protein
LTAGPEWITLGTSKGGHMTHYEVFWHNNTRIWSAVRAFCKKQGLKMGNVEMDIDEVEGPYFIHVDENGVKSFFITIEEGDISIWSV